MGSVPSALVTELRKALSLTRAIETGTFEGDGAMELARAFPAVVTIELSERYYSMAKDRLSRRNNIEVVLGDSRDVLPRLVDRHTPTLYFLDGHWSAGPTSGVEFQCPVMGELSALRQGHPSDCTIIDDARFFVAAAPPPFRPTDWPTLMEVIDALRLAHPAHHITMLGDQIFSVPAEAKSVLDFYWQHHAESWVRRARRRVAGGVLLPWSPARRAVRGVRQRLQDRG